MIIIKILENEEKIEITINQKLISSFRPTEVENIGTCTLVRMSNRDEFVVVDPPFEQWQVDGYITDTDY